MKITRDRCINTIIKYSKKKKKCFGDPQKVKKKETEGHPTEETNLKNQNGRALLSQ